jgi:hypothetical protein
MPAVANTLDPTGAVCAPPLVVDKRPIDPPVDCVCGGKPPPELPPPETDVIVNNVEDGMLLVEVAREAATSCGSW